VKRIRATLAGLALAAGTAFAVIGTAPAQAAAPPTTPGAAALSHWNHGSATVPGGASAPSLYSPANPLKVLAAHQNHTTAASTGLNVGPAAGTSGANTSNLAAPQSAPPPAVAAYELQDAFVNGPTTGSPPNGVTSESVDYGPTAVQGVKEQDLQFSNNHTLQDTEVFGSCGTGNTDCLSGTTPLIEITLSTGDTYCRPALLQCFAVFTWRNNGWVGPYNNGTNPYVEVAGGLADNGTSGPAPGNTDSYGSTLTATQLQIDVDGVEVGYIPLSYWGGAFGSTIANIGLQSEALEQNADYGVDPEPSQNWTFSNYTDNGTGDVVEAPTPTPATGYTGYTVSNVNTGTTQYTISGGDSPETTGGNWPVELSVDSGLCLYDELTPAGSPAISGNCTSPGPGEEWTLNSSNYFVNQKSGLCLTDPGDNTTPGTHVLMETCPAHFLLGATWTTVREANGYTWYKDYSGTVCLLNSNNTTAGNPIEVGGCSYPAVSELFDASYYP
jgi:hypothetical protein